LRSVVRVGEHTLVIWTQGGQDEDSEVDTWVTWWL
jgi:hypothetical protein